MSSGLLVRQGLARGESHRAERVLARMREVEGVSAVLRRLGVHLAEARLGRSADGPYVYYRIEPGREGDIVGRYRALVASAADEADPVAEVVTTFDRLTAGDPESAEFHPATGGGADTTEGESIDRRSTCDSRPAED